MIKVFTQKSDTDILRDVYYDLFISYDIQIKNEYHFVYAEFFEHLLEDTELYVGKNYRASRKSDIIEYKKMAFKHMLYTHFVSLGWNDKLKKPESFTEFKRIVRKNKLNKILNDNFR